MVWRSAEVRGRTGEERSSDFGAAISSSGESTPSTTRLESAGRQVKKYACRMDEINSPALGGLDRWPCAPLLYASANRPTFSRRPAYHQQAELTGR